MDSKKLKRCGLRSHVCLLLLIIVCMPLAAQADDDFKAGAVNSGVSQGIPWDSLSSEEQSLLAPFADNWVSLPAERQQRLRKGIKRWSQLSPEQRVIIKERFTRWQQLPPEERQRVRRRFDHFMALPADERQRLRDRFRNFRNLPAARQEALRQRWQQMPPAERRAVVERRLIRHQINIQQRQEIRREILRRQR